MNKGVILYLILPKVCNLFKIWATYFLYWEVACILYYLHFTFLFIAFNGKGQRNDSTWKLLQLIETEYYSILLPHDWFSMGSVGNIIDNSIDASGMYFPDTFNSAPIIAGVIITNQPATDLEDAKASAIKGYRTNPDRIFPHQTDSVSLFKLESGESAYLIHTRFFRPSKGLNQSRYDLVVYSEKGKRAYLITVSVQYKDETYTFESLLIT